MGFGGGSSGLSTPIPSVHQWTALNSVDLAADGTTLINHTFASAKNMDNYSFLFVEFDLQFNAVSELRLQINNVTAGALYEADGYRAAAAVLTGLADNALNHFILATTTVGDVATVQGYIIITLSNTTGGVDRSYPTAHWMVMGAQDVKEDKSGTLFSTQATLTQINIFSSVANSIRQGSRATIYAVSRTNYGSSPP